MVQITWIPFAFCLVVTQLTLQLMKRGTLKTPSLLPLLFECNPSIPDLMVCRAQQRPHHPVRCNPSVMPTCQKTSWYNRPLPNYYHQAHHPTGLPALYSASKRHKHLDCLKIPVHLMFPIMHQHHAWLEVQSIQVTILEALVIVEWETLDTSTPLHRKHLTVSLH